MCFPIALICILNVKIVLLFSVPSVFFPEYPFYNNVLGIFSTVLWMYEKFISIEREDAANSSYSLRDLEEHRNLLVMKMQPSWRITACPIKRV